MYYLSGDGSGDLGSRGVGGGGVGRQWPPQQPFLSQAPSHKVMRLETAFEAGARYDFAVPPSLFYAFLIFKAVVGPSHKILSNQILFSNLEFRLPSGGKGWVRGSRRTWGEGRSVFCWVQVPGDLRLPWMIPASTPPHPRPSQGSVVWGPLESGDTRERASPDNPGKGGHLLSIPSLLPALRTAPPFSF